MALPAALAAHTLYGTRFHYDSHELAVAEHAQDPRWQLLFPATITQIERRGAQLACSVTTVSRGIARDMRERYNMPIEPFVIRNLPACLPLPPRPIGNPITVLYHGLFKPDRGLLELVDSVPSWPVEYRLVLRGWSPRADFQATLETAIGMSIAANRISVVQKVHANDVVASANKADIGVFLPDLTSLQNRYAMPNKLFEYLNAGLMVIVPAETEMAGFVATANCGLVLSDCSPAGLATALRVLTFADVMEFKLAAHRVAQETTWKEEALRFRRVIKTTYLP